MNTYSNEIMSQISLLSNLLTNKFKTRITELNLISSGDLLNSTIVNVTIIDDGLSINIDSVDYFEYLDNDYNISAFVLDDIEVNNLLTDIYGNMVVELMFVE